MKKIIITFVFLIVSVLLFMGQNFQDKMRAGNPNPQMRRLSPSKDNIEHPYISGNDNYVNPNTMTSYIQTAEGIFAVSPNFRLHPTPVPGSQSETIIYASPLNPNLIFASANTFWSSVSPVGNYCSTNGGLNWYGSDTVSILSYGDPGPVIDKNNTFIECYITLTGQIGVTYSTNSGLTWFPNTFIPGSTTSSDKCLSGTNYAVSSPYYGHSYIVYTEFDGPYSNRIVFSRTTNSGVSWSTIIPISNPPPPSFPAHQGADVTAGPEGNIYAIWANIIGAFPNYSEDSLGFAKSTDGGITWTTRNNAADMNGIRTFQYGPWPISATSFPRMDIDRSGGARNGWIYVAAPEKNFSGGDVSDIFLWRSTDQGTTFSAPIRVNQDPANGKLQFHPAIKVDINGGINVVYHDCRNSNANDSIDTYVSRSIDGGNTWTDIKANDVKFRPNSASGYFGDYIGITTTPNKIIPNWADNRTGRYQSWSALIDITTVGIKFIGSETPSEYYLAQNYPNPFNPVTKISFNVPKQGIVSLKVFDILGRKVSTLVNEFREPGSYSVDFNGESLTNGIYFYRLETNGFTDIKKMALIK